MADDGGGKGRRRESHRERPGKNAEGTEPQERSRKLEKEGAARAGSFRKTRTTDEPTIITY
jgi:hypothetical protein